MKKPRENEVISDLDLRHIFEKVDLNQDSYVNRMVIPLMDFYIFSWYCQEMRLACRYLCKQFDWSYKRVSSHWSELLISKTDFRLKNYKNFFLSLMLTIMACLTLKEGHHYKESTDKFPHVKIFLVENSSFSYCYNDALPRV